MDSLLVDFGTRRWRRMCLGLLPALGLMACTSTTLPKLSDLLESEPPAKVAAAPSGEPAIGPTVQSQPSAPVTSIGKSSRMGAESPPSRSLGGQEMIVGFKGPTVILFGGEIANDGERVAVSSLTLPLQTKTASANTSRVQIETAYGPRWVARSEVTLGPPERAPPSQR